MIGNSVTLAGFPGSYTVPARPTPPFIEELNAPLPQAARHQASRITPSLESLSILERRHGITRCTWRHLCFIR
jgi:hypothetical protein